MALMLIAGMANGLRVYYLVFMAQLLLVLCCFAMNLWTYLSFSYLQKVDKPTAVRGEEMVLSIGRGCETGSGSVHRASAQARQAV